MRNLIILFFLVSFIRFLTLLFTNNSKTVWNAFSSSAISFLATCGYLIPLNQNLEFYDHALDRIPLLSWMVPAYVDYSLIDASDPRIQIQGDPDILSDLLEGISNYASFFIFIVVYLVIIRNGKKYKIDYFIRYNAATAILINLIQVPISFFYVELLQVLTLSQFVKAFTESLAESLIVLNFGFIFYALYFLLIQNNSFSKQSSSQLII